MIINRKYLPSKNFLVALSVAIVVILIAITLNYYSKNINKYLNSHPVADTNIAPFSAFIDLDSDSDGVVDWKENLYGTDIHKADTDADGTSDLEEIAQNRDPLKQNTAPIGQEPNDRIDLAIIEKNQKILEDYQKLTESEKFSRDFMSNIFASMPASGSMDQSTINSIIAKAMTEIPQKNYTGITQITDLNLLKTDSTNQDRNLAEYTKNFFTDTEKLKYLIGPDLAMIQKYLSDENTSSKSDILKIIDKYQAIVNNLVKMPVPILIGYYDINYHLTIINDLEKLIVIDQNFIDSNKNPLLGFSSIVAYNDTAENFFSTLKTIDSILKIQR